MRHITALGSDVQQAVKPSIKSQSSQICSTSYRYFNRQPLQDTSSAYTQASIRQRKTPIELWKEVRRANSYPRFKSTTKTLMHTCKLPAARGPFKVIFLITRQAKQQLLLI
ncbi:hypothetical protein E2P81_ATG11663 [Venturia nashicola]|nr:hypothetical protein E2P81_ATG11663 [Venturia nashicola]